ncbi:hypothetical protein, partial [Streptomyces sp. NPDC058614]|uniref:hypothetical protein n=1 Tax=Streptomyces sp. NPDC058614 TaxID=3346557 RepID=UPI00364D38E5
MNKGADRSSLDWPVNAWPVGTRVRVVQDPAWAGPWPVEFWGTVDDLRPPFPVDHASAREGELVYWVRFDEPQVDSEGDGPYRGAEIWDRAKELLETTNLPMDQVAHASGLGT